MDISGLILQIRKLSLREVKLTDKDHKINKWQRLCSYNMRFGPISYTPDHCQLCKRVLWMNVPPLKCEFNKITVFASASLGVTYPDFSNLEIETEVYQGNNYAGRMPLT
jgi:hypothetical protein